MTTMTRNSNFTSARERKVRFICGVCELDQFTEGYPSEEARETHYAETGHGPVQEWLAKHGRSADQMLAEEKINRAFPNSTVESDEYRRPGSKISGRQYGTGDEIVTKAQLRYAEQLGIKVNGMSKKAASKAIDAAKKAQAQTPAPVQSQADFVPATDKQLDYAKKLIKDLGSERQDVVEIRKELNVAHNNGGVSKSLASSAIDRLLKLPKMASDAPTIAQELPNKPIRITNRYAAKCDLCGEQVEVGEGWWELSDSGNKTVSHKECPQSLDIPNGRYAVEHEGVLKFYVVKPSGLYVMASSEEHKIKSREYINAVVDLIKADPLGAMKRFGIEIGNCGRCGRVLTDETSRSVGLGPICESKGLG